MGFGFGEILLIILLFIILVGPQDGPVVLKTLVRVYRQYTQWREKISLDIAAIIEKIESDDSGVLSAENKQMDIDTFKQNTIGTEDESSQKPKPDRLD